MANLQVDEVEMRCFRGFHSFPSVVALLVFSVAAVRRAANELFVESFVRNVFFEVTKRLMKSKCIVFTFLIRFS